MSKKFSNGSVVWLKSGSPAMTIQSFNNHTKRYSCSWFVGTDSKYDEYTEDSLTDSKPSNG
ncbi:DUF2158 domain-containing protein [Vitellibacter sp. q18]|jgi:uncharacterized protein YodC (DUF2158 family)|nr:DUF2158 domain-containing protein [Aequorivita lutea]|tara:strand:- start:3821 stop:4003 length:183 start_codon:yes stop_codon:yes gene_type:complete